MTMATHAFRLVLAWSIFLALVAPLSTAAVTLHNESIVRTYVGGSTIGGIINISIAQEPADSKISSNVPGGAGLLAFLEAARLQAGREYNCSVASCLTTYTSTGNAALGAAVGEGNTSAYGFFIEGKNAAIQSLDFLLASEIPASCSRQLSVHALDEKSSAVHNPSYVADTSACTATTRGCFSPDLAETAYRQVTLSTTSYCNNVTLEPAPAYAIRATVRASGNTSLLHLRLYTAGGDPAGSCTARVGGTGVRDAECIINMSITSAGAYFMCASAAENKNEYEIRYESEGPVCGGAGVGKTTSGDYDLMAVPLPYAPLANISMARAFKSLTGKLLADEADQYLERVYHRECSGGCTIPFVFSSGTQSIAFQNISLVYVADDNRITERTLYSLVKHAPQITSNRPLVIDLSAANFILPISAQSGRFTLKIGASNLLGTGIALNVTPGFDFEIVPLNALPGIETVFAGITSENITSSRWEFGDGSSGNASGASIIHQYAGGTNYTIRATLSNARGVSVTRAREVIIGNPKEALPVLLNTTHTRIGKVTARIALLPANVQPIVMARLNASAWQAQITAIRAGYAQASNESEYAVLMQRLLALSLPTDVAVSSSGTVPIALGLENADPEFVQLLANESVPEESRETLRLNLIDWNRRISTGTASFSVVSRADESGKVTPLLTHFVVTPALQAGAPDEMYYIIDLPRESLTFVGAPEVRSISGEGVSGTAVRAGKQQLEFYVDGAVEYQSLGAHFAPPLKTLGSYEAREPPLPPRYPLGWVIFWLAVLLAGTLSVYIFLQQWYKHRYERYLFSNPDDLYNILTFIQNSRVSGMHDEAIQKSLKGGSWSGEQLSYAFKKIDGKRTGMFEIPLFRSSEKKKVQEEIRKRQMIGGGDGKFIKRPSL